VTSFVGHYSQYTVYLSLFQADRILEQLQTYIVNYDLSNLREYWSYLNQRLFCRLETRFLSSVRKLEVGLLKFYLVNAQQLNRHDRVLDFFEKMTSELQNQGEFKDWFGKYTDIK